MLEFYQNNFPSDLINNNIANLFNSGAHHLKTLDCNGHQGNKNEEQSFLFIIFKFIWHLKNIDFFDEN